MAESSRQATKIPFFASLQAKYAMSYLAIFAVVLVLLNTYPLLASQNLLFASKGEALKSQAAVMSSALMELETLSADQVDRVMSMLDSGALRRVVVTDPAGLILYDSLSDQEEEPEEPTYRYALYREIVTALGGYDVFYSRYGDRAFHSVAASPIVYRGMVIGAIYLAEEDGDRGALLYNLQLNLRNISLVIALVAMVIVTLFSKMLTARIADQLQAIRVVREGEYDHRIRVVGRDELAQLAREFNQLTDRLQATEDVRRRFVSDASHELKTPLASIRLLADSILQTDQMEGEMVREFVSDIGSEAGRLTRITEHLLALTRLDSLPIGHTEAVDMRAVLERTATLLAPVAAAAGVEMELEGEENCIVRCTPDELQQICFNLMENAVKYNVEGGYVWVSCKREGDQVLLRVEDTGLGIPEEDLSNVFDRFYRVDKARSRAAGGTGLGLSIVRDTVRRHHGSVTAHRRSPRGSIFTVAFPCYVPNETEGEEEQR